VIQFPLSPFNSLAAYGVLSFLASWLVLRCILSSRYAQRLLDQPNERSLHIVPVPRVGGVGILVPVLVISSAQGHLSLVIMLTVLAGLSFIDDMRSLPAGFRLMIHVVASFVFAMESLSNPWATVIVAVVIVWATNLFNFMDGADGLAGGMAFFGFVFLAIAAYYSDQPSLGALATTVSAGALAFLTFNFYPARVFLGDVGSISMGFLAGALGLEGWVLGCWPVWFVPLVFAPFVLDATVTLVRRALNGKRFWEPHRSHYYQRLVRMGWGHRKTALAYYAAMLVCGGGALAGLVFPPALIPLGVIVVLAASIALLWIDSLCVRNGIE